MTFTVDARNDCSEIVHLIYTLEYEEEYTKLTIRKSDMDESIKAIAVSAKSETPVIARVLTEAGYPIVYNKDNGLYTVSTQFMPQNDITVEFR